MPRTGISSGTLRSEVENGLPLPFYTLERTSFSLTFAVDASQQHSFHEQRAGLHESDGLPVGILSRRHHGDVVAGLRLSQNCRRRRWRGHHLLRIVGEEVEDDVEFRVVGERRHDLAVGIHVDRPSDSIDYSP